MADLGANGVLLEPTTETIFDFGDVDLFSDWLPHGELLDATDYLFSAHQWQLTTDAPVTSLIDTQGTITGKVYYDGVPLANQPVLLCLTVNDHEVSRVATDDSGNFVFYGLNRASNTYYLSAKNTISGVLKINITADAFVEIGLYSVTARRPLVLINGIIKEAPDGTTWAVGVPAASVGTYSTNVGDGSNTVYTVTHNLGTRDVVVETRDNNSPYGVVDVDWEATTTNTITVTFQTAPASNRYRVNIISL